MILAGIVERAMHPFDVLVATQGPARAEVLVIILAFCVAIAIMGAGWVAIGDYLRERDGLPPKTLPRRPFTPEVDDTIRMVRSHRRPSLLVTILDELVA